MPDENTEEQRWSERLRHTYRLVVMNNDTFEEIGSYKLSLLNVYILFSSIAVFVALLVAALIIFTPVKRYIPGFGDGKHKEIMALNRQVQEMEAELQAQRAYTNNFRKILVGDVASLSESDVEATDVSDSLMEVERIKEDELLRKEIELEQQIQEKALLSKTANFKSRYLSLEKMYFTPPITGIVGARFDLVKKHNGIDVMAPKNTPIKAVLDGHVVVSDWTLDTGYTLGIQHAGNVVSFYKHNSALLKKVGDYVKAGEAVAIIGNTGTLTNGPHLHFELWHEGRPLDPASFIIFE
ncbi:MAG: peptidoglycan DD-metalloendopeptidase family protein [Bacteroidota bacterium]